MAYDKQPDSASARFSAAADTYDKAASVQRAVALRLMTFVEEGPPPASILDIGCGTGLLTQLMAMRFPDASILAVDTAPRLVEIARYRLSHHRNVRFRVADIRDVSTTRFDLIVSSSSLHWIRPLSSAFSALPRLLHGNGRIVFAMMLDGTLAELHSVRSQVAPSKPVRARLPQRNEVLKCMDAAGLAVRREERQTLRADYPTSRHFLSAIHNVGVTGGHFSASSRPLNRRELRELFERYDSTYSNRRGGVFAMYEILYVDGEHAAPEAAITARRDEPVVSLESIAAAPETPRGLFVTGTDTGVGKTMTAAAILSVLRANNVDAIPMKPVHSGCSRSGSELIADDLEFCLTAAGIRFKGVRPPDMCPYRYEQACSPHLAAAQSGDNISLNRILKSFSRLAAEHECVVVEGAGGPLVPVGPAGTMLDLMTALALPVILVARPGLGTINHTLLALHELRRAGLDVAGVVFCETNAIEKGAIEEDNAATIASLGAVDVLGYLPFLPEPLLSFERFGNWAREHIGETILRMRNSACGTRNRPINILFSEDRKEDDYDSS